MRNRTWLFLLSALLLLAAVIGLLKAYLFPGLGGYLLLGTRLLFELALTVYVGRRKSLTGWILLAVVLGTELGYDLPQVALALDVVGKIFLRLIKSVIGLLIFATLVVGIAGHANLKQVGRMGWKALVYFEAVTALALCIGLLFINLTQAGAGISQPATVTSPALAVQPEPTAAAFLLHIFPENIAKSISDGEILQIVIFSMLFGLALAQVAEPKRAPLLRGLEALAETMFKFTGLVMYLAPLAVGAAIAGTVARLGLDVLPSLLKLLATLYLALLAFLVLVLLPILLLTGVRVKAFLAAIAEPASIAFATSTSEAALPRAMEAMEGLGVPRKIVAFVMPMGYSFNLDGSALYLTLAAVFVAQAAGIHLSPERQLIMAFTLMLTSKGVAGVPRASMVILLGTLASFNLPEWPVYIILGVDALMDMGRTAVNVIGNCLATVVIARWEGEMPPKT